MALFLNNGQVVAELITWQDTTRLVETTGACQLHLLLVVPHQDLLLLHHQLPQHHHPVDVDLLNGKEMIGVMMKTTMLNVLSMEETAVVIMSKLPTVQSTYYYYHNHHYNYHNHYNYYNHHYNYNNHIN